MSLLADLDNYLNNYFPKRQIQIVPGDIVKRTFPDTEFMALPVPEETRTLQKRVSDL